MKSQPKYESHRITTLDRDGNLVSEDIVVVPVTVHMRVKLVLGLRYVIVGIAKIILKTSELLLSLAEWTTDRWVPAELLLKNQENVSEDSQ
jgi:hypothetical protein